jgi:cobyrinic acid a,c-diamide synthase
MGSFQQDFENLAEISVPRLCLVGASKGIGTSTIVLGLVVALKKLGISVSTGSIGPSLSATTQYRRVAGRLSHTVDPWLLSKRQVVESFSRLSSGAELVLLEGTAGLFDPFGRDVSLLHTAQLANLVRAPIVLVVNARGFRESFKAVIEGFARHTPDVEIAGVIASWVENEAQSDLLRSVVESMNGPVYLGGVQGADPNLIECDLEEVDRLRTPSLLSRKRLVAAGEIVQAGVDIEALRKLSSRARRIEVPSTLLDGASRICRIAVADDAAFHLTVQDNLDLIRRAGGELVAFSPLADVKLPNRTKAIYLPNCYLHNYAQDCAANKAMLAAIREFVRAGGAIYAEGGSAAYLCRRVVLGDGRAFDMVGAVPATASAALDGENFVEPEYCEVVSLGSILGPEGTRLRGLRERRWVIRLEERLKNAFMLRSRAETIDPPDEETAPVEGAVMSERCCITSVCCHWASQPGAAEHFIRLAQSSPLKDKDTEK